MSIRDLADSKWIPELSTSPLSYTLARALPHFISNGISLYLSGLAELLGSARVNSLFLYVKQIAKERMKGLVFSDSFICGAVITKILASNAGKASKDLPLVASFLDKSESPIRIILSDVGSYLT